jgi:hypothetical protein
MAGPVESQRTTPVLDHQDNAFANTQFLPQGEQKLAFPDIGVSVGTRIRELVGIASDRRR